MSTVAVTPLVLKDYTLKIDADNFEKAVSAVIFTPPSSSSVTWQGPIGSDFSDETDAAAWTCQVDYVQDWETVGSLAGYLFDHHGETKAITFVPRKGAGLPSFTTSVVLRSGPIGGNARQYATASVTMTCTNGKPTRGVAA